MSIEENKNIVRRYQEIYNGNDLDRLIELMSDDVLTLSIMHGIPLKGRRISFTGTYIARLADGRIVGHWGEEDSISLLQQLGVLKM